MTTIDATATDAVSFGRRAAALLAVRSAHLPGVLDVTVLGELRELELEPVRGPTLAGLLAQRRRLSPGEATTIVIGVARAVAALHDAGYCGVELSGDTVRFDDAGTPVVLGLDALDELVVTGAQGPADDWRAVAALADRLGLVAHGRAAGALGPAQVGLGLALATLTAGESPQNLDRLEAALFELADPAPVRLDGARAAEPERPASPLPERRHTAAHRRPSTSALVEAFDAGPAALLAGPLGAARSRAGALLGRVRGRGRVLLVAVIGGVTLSVAAVLLMPSQAGGGAHRAVTSPTASASPSAGVDSSASPAPLATDAVGTLTGDDPVAAASELLARRDACFPLTGPAQQACLAGVGDGPASDLTEPARPLAGLAPSLLERTGDSALVALTPKAAGTAPASALLMRTEAGWRLRQLYEN
jgi:hypothetical protein